MNRRLDADPICHLPIGEVPYLNRHFKHLGISRTHLREESMVIPLQDIAWNEAVTGDEFRMRSAIPTKNVVRLQTDNAQ